MHKIFIWKFDDHEPVKEYSGLVLYLFHQSGNNESRSDIKEMKIELAEAIVKMKIPDTTPDSKGKGWEYIVNKWLCSLTLSYEFR